jgi:hypothetical protein
VRRSIDGGIPQTSNIFTAILSGSHEISISDANGCGSTIPIVIQLISPKYFTLMEMGLMIPGM